MIVGSSITLRFSSLAFSLVPCIVAVSWSVLAKSFLQAGQIILQADQIVS